MCGIVGFTGAQSAAPILLEGLKKLEYVYGKAAPQAAGIIHLGATSCYVTDNANLIIYRDALTYLRTELLSVLENLSRFADQHKGVPALGYTHYQPAQYLMANAMNAPLTASTQWLERTLDDSANRRISMPEGFLCADAVLRLAANITNGLRVNEKMIQKTVREYLPFIATENLLMEATKRGGDCQQLHEIIRQCSMEATAKMKNGEECDLLDRLSREEAFGLNEQELNELLNPRLYICRCPEQVESFLKKVKPLIVCPAVQSEDIEL